MYETKILISYLQYLSSNIIKEKPNLTRISASRTLRIITYIFIGPPLMIFFIIWIHQYVFLYMHKYVSKLILIISLKL